MRRWRAAARQRAGAQDGMAIALTMIVMTVGFALASVASLAAIGSLRSSSNDQGTKRAFAIAEAGVEQALLRQNKILTTNAFPCLVLGANQTLIPGYQLGNGWCPPQSGTVEGGSYTYVVKPATLTGTQQSQRRITVVSQGTIDGQTRRIAQDAIASTGSPVYADGTVLGLDNFSLSGNAVLAASSGTNSDYTISGKGQLCGNATHGIGKSVILSSNGTVCSGYTMGEKQLVLSPPDPGNTATVNDNGRFFTQDPKSGSVTWNATTRTMTMASGGTVTLGGGNYSFCKLDMTSNSILYVAAGAVVRIWFDSPENCGQKAGTVQMSMDGSSRLSTTSGVPYDLGLMFVGSSTLDTVINLAGDGSLNEVMLYAPRSTLNISGKGNYTGGIAVKSFNDSGQGTINGHPSVLNFTVGVQTAYARERFVECVGALGTDPAAGC